MPKIQLTEFIAPYGQTLLREIEVPETIFKKWQEIDNLGARITIETLRTEDVNVCIEDPEQGDFDMFIAPNKYLVVLKLLIDMIERFNAADFKHWRDAREQEE